MRRLPHETMYCIVCNGDARLFLTKALLNLYGYVSYDIN